jgi:hypothetical protein
MEQAPTLIRLSYYFSYRHDAAASRSGRANDFRAATAVSASATNHVLIGSGTLR